MALPRPQPGDTVLWKEYGFVHIMKTDVVTYCGYDAKWRWNFANTYDSSWFKINENPRNRPVCGTCRKRREAALAKQKATVPLE